MTFAELVGFVGSRQFDSDDLLVRTILQYNDDLQHALKIARSVNLPDWWIVGGVIRNFVWDVLSARETPTLLSDVDIIYRDLRDTTKKHDQDLTHYFRKLAPGLPWSVRNVERRSFIRMDDVPNFSSKNAIGKFPDKASAIGVTLRADNEMEIYAPYGVTDLIHFHIRPTPFYRQKPKYYTWINERKWKENWSRLEYFDG